MRARLTVLQQQAASTVQAASKTRRENLQLYIGNLGQGGITSEMLKQLFDSTMAVAFPTQVVPGETGFNGVFWGGGVGGRQPCQGVSR